MSNRKHLRLLYKMKGFKRFLGAWYIGHLTAEKYSLGVGKSRHFSNVYAYWILLVISLDAFIDNIHINSDASTELIRKVNQILYSNQNSFHNGSYKRIENSTQESLTISILNKMMKNIHSLSKDINETSYNRFLNYALLLLHGEKQSILQKDFNQDTNLAWYVNSVMPHKTYPFILAPIALLPCRENDNLFEHFKKELYQINNLCNYWQVQDDIADLEIDLSNGILSSPIYYLIEQCRIAMQIKEGSVTSTKELLYELETSGMLILHPVKKGSTFDFYELSKFALSNSDKDMTLSHEEIVHKYSCMLLVIKKHLDSKNYKDIYSIVVNSGVLNLLLGNVESFNTSLVEITGKQKNAIAFIGILMRNAIIRANIKFNETRNFIS